MTYKKLFKDSHFTFNNVTYSEKSFASSYTKLVKDILKKTWRITTTINS